MSKRILLLIILFGACTYTLTSFINTEKQDMKNKIIYVWDPMCGWCYGFEPQMEKFQEKYRDEYDFEVIIGGMVLPPNGHSMAQMRGFLQGAIPQLEKILSFEP